METDFDLVVIGAGGAGLAAAVSAAESGLSVIVFESEHEIGGSTQLSAGMMTAAGTEVQREMGIDDAPGNFYQHYMDLNQWKVLPGPTKAFCETAAPVVEWLMNLGVEVPTVQSSSAHSPGLTRAGVEDRWRGHVPKDQGYGLVQTLDRARRKLGVELVLDTRIEELLIGDGEVRGVVADGLEVSASNVVVASGGFGRNPELLSEFYPAALSEEDNGFSVAAKGSRGDHIAFARAHGLELFGRGWGLQLITAYFQRYHHWQSGFPPISRLYTDEHGRRFMDEDAPYAVSPGLFEYHGGFAWAVFDEEARLSLPEGYVDWNASNIVVEANAGRVFRSNSLGGLAQLTGMDASTLVESVGRFNSTLAENGVDPDFLRHETLRAKGTDPHLNAVRAAPFYAVKMIPGELVCTHTGLRIDDRARVRDRNGRTVAGLYAAGEAAGGILGERYVGGGNSVAHAVTMGRIAGLDAANKLVSESGLVGSESKSVL